jgi:hypothetical protein
MSEHSLAHEGREMPIQLGSELDLRIRRGERVVNVRSIPWAMIADCEEQSQKNHDQSLDQIKRRAGFSACEAICVIAGIRYIPIGNDEDVHRILDAMRFLFNRGQRVAEARATARSDAREAAHVTHHQACVVAEAFVKEFPGALDVKDINVHAKLLIAATNAIRALSSPDARAGETNMPGEPK